MIKIKIFIVNGVGGSGKTAFENFIKEWAWQQDYKETAIYSIIDPIKRIATSIGWRGGKTDKDRAFLHNLKVLIHDYNDMDRKDIITKIGYAKELNRDICFIDMREKKDIEYFKALYPDIKTILVKRNTNKIYGNAADDNVMDIEYDYVIENNGLLVDLKYKAIKFYEREIKNGI